MNTVKMDLETYSNLLTANVRLTNTLDETEKLNNKLIEQNKELMRLAIKKCLHDYQLQAHDIEYLLERYCGGYRALYGDEYYELKLSGVTDLEIETAIRYEKAKYEEKKDEQNS